VPEVSRTARGKSAVNLLDLEADEEITAVVNTSDLDPESQQFLTMVTADGYIKRTHVDAFQHIYGRGIIATRLGEGDALVDVEITTGDSDLIVGTAGGMAIRFAETEVRAMGRTARGVHAIQLSSGDHVVGVTHTNGDDDVQILSVTERGYGKRTPIAAYRAQSRYGKGLIDIKTDTRNGAVTAICAVDGSEDLVVMSREGQLMRTRGRGDLIGRSEHQGGCRHAD